MQGRSEAMQCFGVQPINYIFVVIAWLLLETLATASGLHTPYYQKSPCQEYYARQMQEEAFDACLSEAETGKTKGMAEYLLSRLYQDSADDANALRWLAKSAEQGLGEAMYGLYLHYVNGDAIDADKELALKHLRMASEKDVPKALYDLGLRYLNGTGVEKDAGMAFQMIERAYTLIMADKDSFDDFWDNHLASNDYEDLPLLEKVKELLGSMYEKGAGVDKNLDVAARFSDRVRREQHFRKGLAFEKGDGVQQNYARAAEEYVRAGKAEDAQFRLALLFKDGLGVPPKPLGALAIIRELADSGHGEAKRLLGAFHGDSDDAAGFAKAAEFYAPAAEKGDAVAQYLMGSTFDQGVVVQQDHKKAVYWYEKAAAQGFANAQNNLGTFYLGGQGVAKDLASARKLFLAAAAQGNAVACGNLALIYRTGAGVPVDEYEANRWDTLRTMLKKNPLKIQHEDEPLEKQSSEKCHEANIASILRGLDNDDRAVRNNALSCLGELDLPSAIPWVRPLLKDEDSEIREKSLRLLRRLGDAAVDKRILSMMTANRRHIPSSENEKTPSLDELKSIIAAKSRPLTERSRAAERLTTEQVRESIPELISVVEDMLADNDAELEAIYQLGKSGDQRAVPVLTKVIEKEGMYIGPFYTALYALLKLHAPRALEVSRIIIPVETSKTHKRGLIEALENYGAGAVPLLLEVLRTEPDEYKYLAAEILGKMQAVSALGDIQVLFEQTSDLSTRRRIADAMAQLGDDRRLAVYRELFARETDLAARMAIAESMVALGDDRRLLVYREILSAGKVSLKLVADKLAAIDKIDELYEACAATGSDELFRLLREEQHPSYSGIAFMAEHPDQSVRLRGLYLTARSARTSVERSNALAELTSVTGPAVEPELCVRAGWLESEDLVAATQYDAALKRIDSLEPALVACSSPKLRYEQQMRRIIILKKLGQIKEARQQLQELMHSSNGKLLDVENLYATEEEKATAQYSARRDEIAAALASLTQEESGGGK
jgi:TPR repeat protein/HEAT repeat protein